MTEREFIAALAEDQETTVARAEDIVQALSDIIADALGRGDRINLRFGQFELRAIVRENGGAVAAVRFRPSEQLRAALKLADLKWTPDRPLCEDCKRRPVKMEPVCSTCHSRRYRERKAGERPSTGSGRTEKM